jgi:Chaperone of endosialidase
VTVRSLHRSFQTIQKKFSLGLKTFIKAPGIFHHVRGLTPPARRKYNKPTCKDKKMKKNPMETTTPLARDSISRSRLRCGLFLIPLVLAALALSPTMQAQLSPPPDGGYAGDNTAEGTDALFSLTTGTENTALGFNALYSNTTGGENTATGSTALISNTTGIRNTANGFAALQSNTTGERNTATGRAALANNTTGIYNTADGHSAMFFNTIGIRNTGIGSFALVFNTTGNHNTATGYGALNFNTTGNYNAGTGYFALYQNTTGNNNTAAGYNALLNNTTGNQNIALGNFAGSNLTTSDNNIDIGNQGVAGEAGTIRIGTEGTQTAAYIAGILARNTPMGTPVFINANGKLGTVGSSARFKTEVKPMDKASEAILALKPVTFRYKKEFDPEGTPQFGLVAEDVQKINPHLVVRDADGKVYTVRYEAVNAMLLNEFLKEHKKVENLEAALRTVNNHLKDQQAKIDKVSAQLEVSKPAPQLASNKQR